MEIIVDADVIISAEKGSLDLEDWLSELEDAQLAVAAVTVAELWHGVERASNRYREARRSFVQ